MDRTAKEHDDWIKVGSNLCGKTAELTQPDFLPLNEFDGLERFVHVADGEVEAEVEHGVTRGLVAVLQAFKVPERSPGDHLGEEGHGPSRWLALICWR